MTVSTTLYLTDSHKILNKVPSFSLSHHFFYRPKTNSAEFSTCALDSRVDKLAQQTHFQLISNLPPLELILRKFQYSETRLDSGTHRAKSIPRPSWIWSLDRVKTSKLSLKYIEFKNRNKFHLILTKSH